MITVRKYGVLCARFASTFLTFPRPRLLGVNPNRDEHKRDTSIYHEKEGSKHSDEHQIRLDTDRSFVLYPVGERGQHASIAAAEHL